MNEWMSMSIVLHILLCTSDYRVCVCCMFSLCSTTVVRRFRTRHCANCQHRCWTTGALQSSNWLSIGLQQYPSDMETSDWMEVNCTETQLWCWFSVLGLLAECFNLWLISFMVLLCIWKSRQKLIII